MDVKTGNIYPDFKTAIESGAKEEDLIEIDVVRLESDELLMGVLRFLLKDQAFSKEFLLTTIIEYICRENKAK